MSRFTYELNEFDKRTFKDKLLYFFSTIMDILLDILLFIPYKILKLFGKEPTLKDAIILDDFGGDLQHDDTTN